MIKEDGTVVFEGKEQDELNRIIGERVARVKAEKPADYDDLVGIAKELEDFNYTGTPAEKKAAIKAYKEELKSAKDFEDLQQKAEDEGTSPALLKEIQEAKKAAKEANDRLAAIEKVESDKKAVETQKQKDAEQLKTELADFAKAYPDVDLNGMLEDKKFEKFVNKHAKAPVKEIYEDFVEFVGEAESAAIIKVKSKEERSTSGGKGNNSGGSYGLTNDQKTVVDTWNAKNPKMKMSYKEYAERL